MSFFRRKNKGRIVEVGTVGEGVVIEINDNTVIQDTQPLDATKIFWVDTSAE